MKLTDFEKHIDPVITKRGENCLDTQAIQAVSNDANRTYVFEMAGKLSYFAYVVLDIDGETIKATNCSCPFNRKAYCRHQVAAFYYLKEHLNSAKEQRPPTEIETLLSQLDEKTTKKLLFELLEKYPSEVPWIKKQYGQSNH